MKIRHLGTFRLRGEGKVWSENWLGYRDMFDNIRWMRKDCGRHWRRFYGEPEYSAKIHRFRGSSVTEARMLLGIVTAWAECGRAEEQRSGVLKPKSATVKHAGGQHAIIHSRDPVPRQALGLVTDPQGSERHH